MLGLLESGNMLTKTFREYILEHTNMESSNEEELIESNDLNKNNNAELIAQQYLRQPLSDVAAFSTLYDNGFIDKSYVSEYMASQTQELRSTLSDLMGGQSVSRAMSQMAPRTHINAWIDADKLLEWNKSVLLGKTEDIPSYVELVKALLFNTKDLPSTIADGIYEDMCVNAIVCYHTAALVASVAKQDDKPLVDKLKDTYDTICDFYGENTNRGCNAFFNLCVAAIGILRAIILHESGLPPDDICKSTAETADRQFSNAWDNSPGAYFDITIGNAFKKDYGKAYLEVLKRSEKRHGFCLSQEDADEFCIPHSVLIGDTIPSCSYSGDYESLLNESVEHLVVGCENLMKLIESVEDSEVDLDSLVGNVQVESAGTSSAISTSDREMKILELISENEKKLINAIVSNNVTEAVQCLAANTVMEGELSSWTRKIDSPVNTMLAEIRYKNCRYTSIVEANSDGIVSAYAHEHHKDILDDMMLKSSI